VPDRDEIRQAFLCELWNLGLGHASAALSELAREEVRLDVPTLDAVAARDLGPRVLETLGEGPRFASVAFDGDVEGHAVFVITDPGLRELTRRLLGDPDELPDVHDPEREVLAEVSNLILNGMLATLADQLELPLETEVPACGDPGSTIRPGADSDDELLLITVELGLAGTVVEARAGLVLAQANLRPLWERIDTLLARHGILDPS